LLSCAHQKHDKINVYHVHIISGLYLTPYRILYLSYLNHQTGPMSPEYSFFWICNDDTQIIDWNYNWM